MLCKKSVKNHEYKRLRILKQKVNEKLKKLKQQDSINFRKQFYQGLEHDSKLLGRGF